MSVLDLATTLGNQLHGTHTEVIAFSKGRTLVVAVLVVGRENALIVADNIVFQLAHGMEFHTCHLPEGSHGLVKRIFRGRCQRIAVTVEERTEHTERRNLRERINECRRETRHDIKVAAGCGDEAEEGRPVDAFTVGKDGLQIFRCVQHEVQGLQPSVTGRIHEVDHPDVQVADNLFDVLLRKLVCVFAQVCFQSVG